MVAVNPGHKVPELEPAVTFRLAVGSTPILTMVLPIQPKGSEALMVYDTLLVGFDTAIVYGEGPRVKVPLVETPTGDQV